STKQREKNANFKLAMKGAKEKKAGSVPGLEVTFSNLTNSPEIFEMRGVGRKFMTPPSSQPRENIVRSFINEHADMFGMSGRQVARLKKTADYANPNGRLSWLRMEQELNGIRVFGGETTAVFTSDGEMARMVSGLAGGTDEQALEPTPKVSAAAAVVAAAASVGGSLNEDQIAVQDTDGQTAGFFPV